MEIQLAHPSHQEMFARYMQICLESKLDYYELAEGNPKRFLSQLIANAQGQQLPEGWVPCSTYFAIQDGEILGAIRVRHGTDDVIANDIGHIGYDTKPSARGKGVASGLLDFVKTHVIDAPAYLICDQHNIASRKVIERAQGVWDEDFSQQPEHSDRLRYLLAPSSFDHDKPSQCCIR